MRHNALVIALFFVFSTVSFGAMAQDAGVSLDATVTVAIPASVSVADAATLATAVSPVSPEDPAALVSAAAGAAAGGHWAIFAGFALMLLVWGVKKAVPSLPSLSVPWIATVLGLAGYLGHSLVAGGDWKTALTNGFLAGASAVGLWELIFQHVLADKTPKA